MGGGVPPPHFFAEWETLYVILKVELLIKKRIEVVITVSKVRSERK